MKKPKDKIKSGQERHLSIMPAWMNRFEKHLKKRGHTRSTIHLYLLSAKHFTIWLESEPSSERRLSYKTIQIFLNEHLPGCCCQGSICKDIKTVRAALNQMLSMEGYEKNRSFTGSVSPEVDVEIELFDQHLQKIYGHSEATRWYHRRHVRAFLSWLFGDQPILVEKITSETLYCFVSEQAIYLRPASIGTLLYSLRTYLRYLQFIGNVTPSLEAKLPKPPNWSGANLPQRLSPNQLKQFWSVFDQRTASGKRDYAMARCLADLGLRCYEVANLHLDDIDWHNGVLHLTNKKSRREETLPIPDKMIQSLISYLRYGRPKTKSRSVFVFHRAPFGEAVKKTTVRGAIRRAFSRAGLSLTGTHVFRSTLASRLFESGVPLKNVAEILRHKSIDTSKNYTRVDLKHLTQVALPWPGRLS